MWFHLIGILGILKFLEGRGKKTASSKPSHATHPPAVPIPAHGHKRKSSEHAAKPAAHKPAAAKPAAHKPTSAKPAAPKPAAPKPAAPKPVNPIEEILALPKPGEKPKPTAAKPAAHKPKPTAANPTAPPSVHLPEPAITLDVHADESNRQHATRTSTQSEHTTRSPTRAANDLLTYVNNATGSARATLLGLKSRPSSFVQSAQQDMGGITADGIYGPATRQRGKALLGKSFPPR